MSNKEKDDYLTSIAKTYFGTYAVFGIMALIAAVGILAHGFYKAATPSLFMYLGFGVCWILLMVYASKVKNLAIKLGLFLLWFFSPLFFKYFIFFYQ